MNSNKGVTHPISGRTKIGIRAVQLGLKPVTSRCPLTMNFAEKSSKPVAVFQGSKFRRMPIEEESPEEREGGYGAIVNNLAESSCTDRTWGDLQALGVSIPANLMIQYSDHKGLLALRSAIAADGGESLSPSDVLLAGGGAATALYLIHSCLLGQSSNLLVLRPNYATNLETPRAIGCNIDFFDLSLTKGWQLDVDEFCNRIKPDTTLVSITTPHNPSGVIISQFTIMKIVTRMVAVAPHCRLLVDETYREMMLDLDQDNNLPLAATLHPRIISVSSLSKTYGLPGLRMGWIVSQDAALMNKLLCAKEQIVLSGSVLDEEVSAQVLAKKADLLPQIRSEIRMRRAVVLEWLSHNKDIVECTVPQGGVVCFPHITAKIDTTVFYERLYAETGTIVGPGHWFEQSDTFFRLGFGWSTVEQLHTGLACISKLIRELATGGNSA